MRCALWVQEVDELYTRAIRHFKDESIIHVFAAQFHNIYRSNHRVEQIHLTEAEVLGRQLFFSAGSAVAPTSFLEAIGPRASACAIATGCRVCRSHAIAFHVLLLALRIEAPALTSRSWPSSVCRSCDR